MFSWLLLIDNFIALDFQVMQSQFEMDLGMSLYVHIPFCRSLCHYCDFAKTANFTSDLVQNYLNAVIDHTRVWLEHSEALEGFRVFNSVFFGGGTPSLLSLEYKPLMAMLQGRLSKNAEITIEANPDDLTPSNLAAWRESGINRISIGVQTFNRKGLAFLKRNHSAEDAFNSLGQAAQNFAEINVDLIYGWPGQSFQMWKDDLNKIVECSITHLSLYHLTYESKTPIGRAFSRGKIQPIPDDHIADLYEYAQDFLASKGFIQYEVSNWSKPQSQCKQNINYWSGASYIGVGSGAHGYLAHRGPYGLRYFYPRRERSFGMKKVGPEFLKSDRDLSAYLEFQIDGERDGQAWLFEQLGSSLRSVIGFNVSSAERKLQREYKPSRLLEESLEQGLVFWKTCNGDRFLELKSSQWFLEQSWAHIISEGFLF